MPTKREWYLQSVEDFLSQQETEGSPTTYEKRNAVEDRSVEGDRMEEDAMHLVEVDVVPPVPPTLIKEEKEEGAELDLLPRHLPLVIVGAASQVEMKEEMKEDRVARHLRKISIRRMRRDQLEAELSLVDKDVASLKLELTKQEQLKRSAKALVASREKELVLAKERLLHVLLSANNVLNQFALESKRTDPQPQIPSRRGTAHSLRDPPRPPSGKTRGSPAPMHRVSFASLTSSATPLPLSTSSTKSNKLYRDKVAQIVDFEEKMADAWIRARRGFENLARQRQLKPRQMRLGTSMGMGGPPPPHAPSSHAGAFRGLDAKRPTESTETLSPTNLTGLPAGLRAVIPSGPSPPSMATTLTPRRRRSTLTRPPPPPRPPPSASIRQSTPPPPPQK